MRRRSVNKTEGRRMLAVIWVLNCTWLKIKCGDCSVSNLRMVNFTLVTMWHNRRACNPNLYASEIMIHERDHDFIGDASLKLGLWAFDSSVRQQLSGTNTKTHHNNVVIVFCLVKRHQGGCQRSSRDTISWHLKTISSHHRISDTH